MKWKLHIARMATIALVLPMVQVSSIRAQAAFRVSLEITCEDELMKNQVESLFSRELRSLNDVVIVNNKPNWHLAIICITTENLDRVETGYAMSVVALHPMQAEWFEYLVELDSEAKTAINEYDIKDYRNHWVLVGSSDGLEVQIDKVVASFDAQQLQPIRLLLDN